MNLFPYFTQPHCCKFWLCLTLPWVLLNTQCCQLQCCGCGLPKFTAMWGGAGQSQPWKFAFSLFFHLTLLGEGWRSLHCRRVCLSRRSSDDHGKELLLGVKAGLSIAGLPYPAHNHASHLLNELCSLGSQATLDFIF